MPRHAWWLVGCLLLAVWMLVAPAPGGAAPNAGMRLVVSGTPTQPPTPTNTPTTPTNTSTTPRATLTPTATQHKQKERPTPSPTLPPTAPPTGDPHLTKSVDPSSGRPGDKITFMIVARNDSSIPATDVVVDDTFPDVFEITGATASQGTVTVSGQHIHAEIGTIPPGGEAVIHITTVIRAGTPPGQVENVAVMTTTTPGDDPSNNTSSVTVTILGPPPPARLPRTSGATPGSVLLALLASAALLGGLALRARRRAP